MMSISKLINSIICIIIFLTVFFFVGAFIEYDLNWIDFKNDESDRLLFLLGLFAPLFLCITIGPFKVIDVDRLRIKFRELKERNKSKINLK